MIFVFPVLSFSMFSLFSLFSQILPFLRDLRVPCSLVLHVLSVLILPFLRDLRVPCSLVLHVLTVLSVLSDSSFPSCSLFSRSPCSHGSLCTLRFFLSSVIFMFPVLSFSMFSLFSLYSQVLRDLHVPCSLVLHVLMVLPDSSFSP